MVQVIEFLLPKQETWIKFLALSIGPALAIAGIWEVNQWMRFLSLPLCVCLPLK